MQKLKTQKGITLIALVITIIVMLILAGAIILTLNNSGIMGKASEAVDKTNEATVNELAQTKWAEAYLTTNKSQQALEEYVLTELEKEGIDINEYAIRVTTSGVIVKKGSVIVTVDGVPIPKGFIESQATGENKAEKGLVIYEGNVEVTDENVEDARRTRNQYVWVPVDKDKFEKEFVREPYTSPSFFVDSLGGENGFWEVHPSTELNEENLKYMTKETLLETQAMYSSVKQYGGFYIARYEAGIDEAREPST